MGSPHQNPLRSFETWRRAGAGHAGWRGVLARLPLVVVLALAAVPPVLTVTGVLVLSSVFESEVLLQIIFYGIFNVISITEATGSAPPSAEAILDQCLHLLMLALIERPQSFSYIAVSKVFEEDQTLLDWDQCTRTPLLPTGLSGY